MLRRKRPASIYKASKGVLEGKMVWVEHCDVVVKVLGVQRYGRKIV
jgi:hypothetical protein